MCCWCLYSTKRNWKNTSWFCDLVRRSLNPQTVLSLLPGSWKWHRNLLNIEIYSVVYTGHLLPPNNFTAKLSLCSNRKLCLPLAEPHTTTEWDLVTRSVFMEKYSHVGWRDPNKSNVRQSVCETMWNLWDFLKEINIFFLPLGSIRLCSVLWLIQCCCVSFIHRFVHRSIFE